MRAPKDHEPSQDPAPGAPAVAGIPVGDRTARVLFWLALTVALAPFVVAAIAILTGAPRVPIDDRAMMQMRTDDVGHYPVLIGLYSRDGWAHPGPLLYYLLAGPYRLFGSSTASLLTGALILNAAAVAGMAGVARRLAGLPGALVVLAVVGVMVRALGADYVSDPWVCFVTVLPFGAFCLLVWAMASGERWALPASVVVASYLVQTHIGYVALAGPLLIGGGVWLFLHARRTRALRPLGRAALVSLVGLAVLWSPTVWDQVYGTGNLTKVLHWFRDANEGTHTIGEGLRVVFGQFAIDPGWITGDRPVSLFSGETTLRTHTIAPVLLVAVVAAVALALRRRDRATLRLFAVVAAALTVGVVAVARTIGVMYEYRLQWTWMLAVLAIFASVLSAWRWAVDRWPGTGRFLVPVAMSVIAVLAVVNVIDALASKGDVPWVSARVGRVSDRIAAELDRSGGQVVVIAKTGVESWDQQGIVLALERKGFDARVPGDIESAFGHHRAQSEGPVEARLLVLTSEQLRRYRPDPAWKVVAFAGDEPLRATQRALTRIGKRQRDLIEALQRGEIDASTYDRRRRSLDRITPEAVLVLQATG